MFIKCKSIFEIVFAILFEIFYPVRCLKILEIYFKILIVFKFEIFTKIFWKEIFEIKPCKICHRTMVTRWAYDGHTMGVRWAYDGRVTSRRPVSKRLTGLSWYVIHVLFLYLTNY
jgi:hypothetical protein